MKQTFWHDRRLWKADDRIPAEFAKQIIDDKAPPKLTLPKQGNWPCQVAPGDVLVIDKAVLWLDVTNVESDGNDWKVSYRLNDHRPHLLARRSGYTDQPHRAIGANDRAATGSLRDEPEAVDPDTVGSTRADVINRRRVAIEQSNDPRKEKQQMNRLRNARQQAKAGGIDTTALDAAIEREIKAIEDQIGKAA